jgi:hypothetical protein
MFTYPNGVLQNMAVQPGPPDLQAVPESNWRMFASLADAQQGLKLIIAVSPNATMEFANSGEYSQYVYATSTPDVCVRIANGRAQAETGQWVGIQEYPSDILDRFIKPMPMIDKYTVGEPHVLKCQFIVPGLGQLYWAAA